MPTLKGRRIAIGRIFMEKQIYRTSSLIGSCFAHTFDFFGIWFWITTIKFIIAALQISGFVFIFGFSIRLFIGSVPENPLFAYPESADAYFTSIWLFYFSIFAFLLFEFLGGIIRMGAVQISFDLQDEKEINFSRLLAHTALAWRHFCAAILFDIIVIIGFCCFIVPGIIFMIRFWFYRHALIEKQGSAISSLKESVALTKGKMRQLLPHFTLLGILNEPMLHSAGLLGFISLPVATQAHAFFYRHFLLIKQH